MKRNFKKLISLFLIVAMLAGLMVVASPVSTSADESTTYGAVSLKTNADNWVNGQNYRLETTSSNSQMWIAEGYLYLVMQANDVFWIPTLTVKDTSSAFTFEQMATTVDNTKIQVLTHVKNGASMYGTGWDSSSAWLCALWQWGDYNRSIWNYNLNLGCWGGSNSSWGGTSTPSSGSNNTFDGYWNATVESLSIRTTFETWDNVNVPRTFFYGGYNSLDGTNSDYRYDSNFRWYPRLDTCVGTSFGLSARQSCRIAIGKITAKNMNETSSYTEDFENRTILPNTDNWINGQNYRFETYQPASSYAKIEKGKLVLKMSEGDLFWIPTLTVKDTTSAFTFENMFASATSAIFQIMNHVAVGQNMSSVGYANSANWVCASWGWKDSGTKRIDVVSNNGPWYATKNAKHSDWPGSNNPGQNGAGTWTGAGDWLTSEAMSVRVKFETWGALVAARTYLYEGTASLGSVTSNNNNDVNLCYYPYYGTCVGTSVGFGSRSNNMTYTIDKITATNMNQGNYTETFTSLVNPALSGLAGSSAINTGVLRLNILFQPVALPAEADVVVTKAGTQISSNRVTSLSTDGGYRVVTIPVNAKEMTDTINVSIKWNGTQINSLTFNYSLATYANTLRTSGESAEWKTFGQALLNYGRAAQAYKNYNTGSYPTNSVDPSTLPAVTGNSIQVVSGDTSNLRLMVTLNIEDDTSLNLYFNTRNGAAISATLDSAPASLTESGNYRLLKIANLGAGDLATDHTVVVNGVTLRVSVTRWAKYVADTNTTDNPNANTNMKNLAKAIKAYSVAAEAVGL